jgi:hypothetical protein
VAVQPARWDYDFLRPLRELLGARAGDLMRLVPDVARWRLALGYTLMASAIVVVPVVQFLVFVPLLKEIHCLPASSFTRDLARSAIVMFACSLLAWTGAHLALAEYRLGTRLQSGRSFLVVWAVMALPAAHFLTLERDDIPTAVAAACDRNAVHVLTHCAVLFTPSVAAMVISGLFRYARLSRRARGGLVATVIVLACGLMASGVGGGLG